MNERDAMLLPEWEASIKQKITSDSPPFLTVYKSYTENPIDVGIFCALAPVSKKGHYLNSENWDLQVGDGYPGWVQTYHGKKILTRYYRFGGSDHLEPMVLDRNFHGIKPDYREISEEFRLFHNLYFDTKNSHYFKIYDSGEEEIIIKMSDSEIQISTHAIQEFLGVKRQILFVYYDIKMFSARTLSELRLTENLKKYKDDNSAYFLLTHDEKHVDSYKSFSRLLGKKVVSGYPKSRCDFWPGNRKSRYEVFEFISNGKRTKYTCDHDKLSNYFTKRGDAPMELTPVFFKREVLQKYYLNPNKYKVEDSYLRCGGLWGVHIDNNMSDYVAVFLCDLAHLPYQEQQYWRLYNVVVDESISRTNFSRSFFAQFAAPESVELKFKSIFKSFKQDWADKYGWAMFKELAEDDSHYLDSLHTPLNDTRKEFDDNIGYLAKVLIESINEEKLSQEIGQCPPHAKGIEKLYLFLTKHKLPEADEIKIFLKNLHRLRCGCAHRKGEDTKKAEDFFKLDKKPLKSVFEDILSYAIDALCIIRDRLIVP